MTWDGVLLVVLAAVDVAALAVGLTILRRVTAIVVETGEAIDRAVRSSIDEARKDAVAGFVAALGPALGVLGQQLPAVVREAVGHLHIRADGTLLVDDGTYTGDVHTGPPGPPV